MSAVKEWFDEMWLTMLAGAMAGIVMSVFILLAFESNATEWLVFVVIWTVPFLAFCAVIATQLDVGI